MDTETGNGYRVEWTIGSHDDIDRERGTCSLCDWLDSNGDAIETPADLMAFARGEVLRGGGGAAPEWTARLLVKGGAA